MVEAIAPLLDDGKVKLYCVPSFDRDSWTRGDLPLEERARRHGHYEWWVLTKLVPFVQADSHTHELMAAGASFGAYHSVNFCLKRSDLFPLAIGMSGVYDVSVQGGGERGEAVYFNNPMDYVANLHGDHLDWLRRQASVAPRLRPGAVGGHDRRARLDEALRRAARREGHPARGRPVGPRRPARLALVAAPARPPSAKVRRDERPRDRPVARHRGGLAGRVRGARLAARAGRRQRAAHRAHRQRAVRPALPPALLDRHRPARVVVRPAARVAEEGLADGRRLSAEQPVHVPGDGEALGVLRADAARHPRARDVADPAQGAAAEPALPADRRALQRAVRPRGDRRPHRLPALHEAVRRRPVGRRLARRARRRSSARATTSRASG